MDTKSITQALKALASEKASLEKVQLGWENALSIALGVTAIAALLIFLFDLQVRRTSKHIQEVQDDIIRNKDAEAIERAANLESGNLQLRTDLEKATAESTRRQTELEVEQRKTAEAQESAYKAQLTVQSLMVSRVLLMAGANSSMDSTVKSSNLPKYAGTVAFIQAFPGEETEELALNLREMLRHAGWKAELADESHSQIPRGMIRQGVHLFTLEEPAFTYSPDGQPSVKPSRPWSPASRAAQSVVELLEPVLGRPPFGVPYSA